MKPPQCSPCTETATIERSPTSSTSTTTTTTPIASVTTTEDKSSYERRNIIAKGQTRFEGISKLAPPQPSIERLSERVINVLGMNPAPYTLNGTNCYLVGTGPKRILIDTGNPPLSEMMFNFGGPDSHVEFLQNLVSICEEENCEIELILVTHLHFDHFGGVRGILNQFGQNIPVGMLPAPRHHMSIWTMLELEQRGMLDLLESGPSPFANGTYNPNIRKTMCDEDIPEWPNNNDVTWDIAGRNRIDIQLDYHYMKRHYAFYKAWYDSNDTSMTARFLKHGEIIRTEGATLRVMFTPGHAENHASFVLDEERSIFSGDNVLGYGTTQLSELYDYMASLEAMQRYSPARLYPGHGGCIYDGSGLLTRYYAHRQSREDQIFDWLFLMKKEKKLVTAMDIAQEFYVNTPPKRMIMAKENIERILLKLYRSGSAIVWKSREGVEKGSLPKYGYMNIMDEELSWELKDSSTNNSSESLRHEKFVAVLFNAMGVDPIVDSFPKILEPEDILKESGDEERQNEEMEAKL